MKTLNRQTASICRNQLENLSSDARALWTGTPPGNPDQREDLCMQLICLEADIDRLRIRSSAGEDDSMYVAQLVRCSDRLVELEYRWRSGPISSTGVQGTAV